MRRGNLKMQGVLTLSPELWVGVLPEYHPQFNEEFKQTVEVFAFDPQSKARWFPISYLPFVKQLLLTHKNAAVSAVDQAHLAIQAELNRRTFLKVNTDTDGNLNPEVVKAFTALRLHPSASRMLVEWAIIAMRKEAEQISVPQTDLARAEEAYQFICSGGHAR